MSDYNDGILPEPCLRMDTHFGDEYESVEFGDGTGYIKAAPALAKVGALHEEIDRLRDESAELRELAEKAWKAAERLCQAFDGPCSSDGVTAYKPCPMGERYEECVYGQLHRELHELVVDV